MNELSSKVTALEEENRELKDYIDLLKTFVKENKLIWDMFSQQGFRYD